MNDGEERFEADFRISDAVDSFYTRWNALSQPYFAWQFEQFAPYLGRRVADVGCGPANLTPFCLDRDLYLGADLDPAMTGRVTRRFGSHPSVHTYTGNVLEPAFPEEMKRLGIDTVVCLNFLAHVVDERRALANMIDPLPEGGRLCLLVPAHPAIKGDLEKIDGMLRRYTRAMLHERFETLPVTVLKMFHFNMVGAAGWWLKSRVLKQTSHSNSNFTLMNRLIPLLRPLEKAVRVPFGLSLIAVVEKKAHADSTSAIFDIDARR